MHHDEEDISPFRVDAHGIYLYDHKFTPLIWEGELSAIPSQYNVFEIKVTLKKESKLTFSRELQLAEEASSKGLKIFWNLDFGILSEEKRLNDPITFMSLEICLLECMKVLINPLKEKTFGVCFCELDGDISRDFLWDTPHVMFFYEWLETTFKAPTNAFIHTHPDIKTFHDIELGELAKHLFGRHLMNVFAMNVLAEFVHRLASLLPDEIPGFVFFDLTDHSNAAMQAQIFHKERFSHLLLGMRHASVPCGTITWQAGETLLGFKGASLTFENYLSKVTVGVCLPSDELCSESFLFKLQDLLDSLKKSQIAYRIVPEALLTESWEGLDYIIYFENFLGPQCRRKLFGFEAAGGTILEVEDENLLDSLK